MIVQLRRLIVNSTAPYTVLFVYCCRPGLRVAGGGGGGAGVQRAAALRVRQEDRAAAGVEMPGVLLHLRLQGIKVRVLFCYEA